MSHLHLLPDEYVIAEMRRHPLVVFLDLLLFGFLMIIPIIIYAFVSIGNVALSDYPVVMAFIVLATSVYYLYIWLFTLHSLMDYVLDIWIITNERIIDMEQKGLFALSLSEQEIYRIQDITAEINGVLPTLFNYGNVYIQSAGEKERFIFKQIRNPKEIVQVLSHLLEENNKRNTKTDPQ